MHLISIAKLFTNLGGDEQDACYLSSSSKHSFLGVSD